MSDLVAAMTPVAEVLDRLDVPYQIGGSVASSLYGKARATMDIDVVADLEESHIADFVAALEADYYVDGDMIRNAVRARSSFNLIHQQTVFKIDIFLPKDRPYDRQALARRHGDRLEERKDAREFSVATPEDVILAKLDCSGRQWGDILGILRVQEDGLDFPYLQQWAGMLGLAELLERAIAER